MDVWRCLNLSLLMYSYTQESVLVLVYGRKPIDASSTTASHELEHRVPCHQDAAAESLHHHPRIRESPHMNAPEQRTYLSSDGAFDAPTLNLRSSLARCAEGRLVRAGFSVMPFVVQPRHYMRTSDWAKAFAKIAACG
jgi:hypothetical protein